MTWKRKLGQGAAAVSLMAVDYCFFGGILPVEALFGNIFSSEPKESGTGQKTIGAEKLQEKLNSLLQTGKFDAASRLIADLNLPYDTKLHIYSFILFHKSMSEGDFTLARKTIEHLDLTSDAKQELLKQIEDMEWSRDNRHKIQEWNDTINSHLKVGDVEGAIRFVKKCGMPWRKEQEVIQQIRVQHEQQQEQQAQAEAWKKGLVRMLQMGEFLQARMFIKSLPITEESKQALLAQLPPDPFPRLTALGGFFKKVTRKL